MKEYYDSFKKSRWFSFLTGILAVILGVLGLVNPQVKMESVALFAGIVFGCMDISMKLSAAYSLPNLIKGNTSPHLDTDATSGSAEWQSRTADMSLLVR